MTVKVANNAWGSLRVAISSTDTTVLLESAQGDRFPSIVAGKDIFYVTLISDSNELEIVKVTEKNNDVFTVVRGQSDTIAKEFIAGARVELRLVKELFDSKVDITDYETDKKSLQTSIDDLKEKTTSSLEKAVGIEAQELTDAEKAQARENIDALSVSTNEEVSGQKTWTSNQTFNAGATFNSDLLLEQVDEDSLSSYGLVGRMGENDFWRIKGITEGVKESTTSNVITYKNYGALEIATSDNGNEPIYVRQYSGGDNDEPEFKTLVRSLTLLDKDGNTTMPGTTYSSGYQATSDKRLKRNFKEIADVDAVIRAITGCSYDRLDVPGRHVGVIAQDVQKVVPEAVKETEMGYLSVDYNALVAVLIEGYKSLAKRVDVLESRRAKVKKANEGE